MILIKIIFYPITLLFMFLIKLYKWLISPLLPHTCRFYPSCSTYSLQAYKEYGLFMGTYYTLKRLLSCSPKHEGGFDPLPQNIKGDSKWII